MSERSQHRKPATFKLDDPAVIVMDPDDASRPARGTVHVTPESDPALLPVPVEAEVVPAQRGFRWGALFWSAVGGLTLLGVGLGVTRLIEDLFARSESLGFLGLAFAFVAALAFIVVVTREAFGLMRLATIEKLHLRAIEVLAGDEGKGEAEKAETFAAGKQILDQPGHAEAEAKRDQSADCDPEHRPPAKSLL